MDHPYKHKAFKSVFIYTKVINNVDFHAKNLQNLNKTFVILMLLMLCK